MHIHLPADPTFQGLDPESLLTHDIEAFTTNSD